MGLRLLYIQEICESNTHLVVRRHFNAYEICCIRLQCARLVLQREK